MGIFNLDSPFVKYMSLVADIIMLSFVFTITSIPIFTIGPSTTALYYVMTKRIYEKEAYIFRDYFRSFKQNFVQSTLTGVLFGVLQTILGLNILFVVTGQVFSLSTLTGKILFAIYVLLFVELSLVSLYVFPVISRFHLSFVQAIKTSFILANKHMPSTISVGCLYVLIMYLTIANPFLIFVSMGIYTAFASYFFMRIFKIYRPNIDMYEHEISYQAINEHKEEIEKQNNN